MKRQIFKPYEQKQGMLLPLNLEVMIPQGNLVRVVSDMIDGIDKRILESQYKGGSTSAYDPRMLLKVIVYAYSQWVFSSLITKSDQGQRFFSNRLICEKIAILSHKGYF